METHDKTIDILILSAGKGSRVKRLFPDKPKALIEHKKKCALEYVLMPFKKTDGEFHINLNVRADEVQFFKDLGYNLLIEDTPLGNAGAIKYFGKNLSDPFIVSHNDIFLPQMNPISLCVEHLQNDSFVTMTVFNLVKEKERGIILKKYNKVLGFTRERWVNCGFYCISHKAFEVIEDGFQDIDEHLLPRLSSIHQLSCFDYKGFYEDWGR